MEKRVILAFVFILLFSSVSFVSADSGFLDKFTNFFHNLFEKSEPAEFSPCLIPGDGTITGICDGIVDDLEAKKYVQSFSQGKTDITSLSESLNHRPRR